LSKYKVKIKYLARGERPDVCRHPHHQRVARLADGAVDDSVGVLELELPLPHTLFQQSVHLLVDPVGLQGEKKIRVQRGMVSSSRLFQISIIFSSNQIWFIFLTTKMSELFVLLTT
jgi:hypothetical protein